MLQPVPLYPERLTWASLLGRWIEFARSATALPADADGRRLKASVADVVMLQAVWFALQQLGGLDAGERALGLDRAEVLVEKHAAALSGRWGGGPLPVQLAELIDDARRSLREAAAGSKSDT